MAIQFLNTGYFPDNAKLTFGDATTPDLEIYHDGTHSYIDDVGTGSLYIKGGSSVQIESNTGENMIVCSTNAAVELYYDNSKKLETTNIGIEIDDTSVIPNAGNSDAGYWLYGTHSHGFASNANGDFRLRSGTSGGQKTLLQGYYSGTKAVIDVDNYYNIGIGTITPSEKLTVAGNIKLNSNGNQLRDYNGNNIINNTSNKITIGNAVITDVLISNGDVGIGTATPTQKLEVQGTILVNNEIQLVDGNMRIYRGSDNMYLRTGGSNRVTIASGGDATFTEDILTNTDSSSDIGKTATRWANIWVDNINGAAPRTGDYLPLAGGTMVGNLNLNDSINVNFGTSSDLRIYHNATNSNIENFTGDLQIIQNADDKDIVFKCDDGVGGTETYFYLDGSAGGSDPVTKWPDNSRIQLGTGGDADLYHDGTNTYFYNSTGDLQIINYADDKDIIFASDNGSGGTTTYMFLDGSYVGTRFLQNVQLDDNVELRLGTNQDLRLEHTGSHGTITNYTGNLTISNTTDDGDIIFKSDDGLGGTTEYFRLDGSSVLNVFTKPARWEDGVQAQFGGGNDLRIQHDGTDSLNR